MIGFLVRMAWQETRAGWRHFVFFLGCIALGVGAVVGIGLFASNVEEAVLREARGLHGGDLEIRLSHGLSKAGQEVLRSLDARGATLSHATELVAMASAPPSPAREGAPVSQLVELKAVDDAYPLYGTLRLDPDRPLTELLFPPESACARPTPLPEAALLAPNDDCHGAVVQESLLIRMRLSIGQDVKIGQARFRITGIVRKEPDRMATMFSLGPRVLISQRGLDVAQLIKPGSRVRERYLLRIPPSLAPTPLLHELREQLAADSARLSTFRDAQPQLKQFLDQLSRYLGLIGLTVLFVGGIGIALSIQAFLRNKIEQVAILKTFGANSGFVIRLYLVQSLALAMVGAMIGVGVGLLLQIALPQALSGLLDTNLLEQVEFEATLNAAALLPIGKGIALGVLTALLFTLWPLLQVQDMRPAAIFRRDVAANISEQARPALSDSFRLRRSRWWRWDRLAILLTIGGSLCLLSLWQATSWLLGTLFVGGLLLAVLLLSLVTKGLLSALPAMPMPRSVGLRYALGNLTRPGGHSIGIILALGIGVTVLLTIALIERSLVAQMQESRPVEAPTFFFIDVQPDQAAGFATLLHQETGVIEPDLTPLVRSRLQALNGRPIPIKEEGEQQDKEDRDERRRAWYLTREYVLTYQEHLPKDNRVIKGAWWRGGSPHEKPLVSVEEEAAKNLGLDIGSTVTLDIQGARLTAEVSSIRRVAWGNFSTNFYMILSPGSLDGAPMTYVAAVRVLREQEVPLQQKVVAAYPNVTAIHIGEVLDSFAQVLDRLSLAIQAVALFCIVAAGLVMGAALAVTRYRRLYESVILKALGATRGLIAGTFAAEYLLLGAVAGIGGTVLASGLSWAVLRFVFELPWALRPGLLAAGWACTVTLTVLIGFGGTFSLLGQRPLPILRRE
jgi:putative ABC transport system permease protein